LSGYHNTAALATAARATTAHTATHTAVAHTIAAQTAAACRSAASTAASDAASQMHSATHPRRDECLSDTQAHASHPHRTHPSMRPQPHLRWRPPRPPFHRQGQRRHRPVATMRDRWDGRGGQRGGRDGRGENRC